MKKLLVVDDEHDICDFVQNFFRERGYTVLTALSGEDALLIVKAEKPDLVLLDIKMKGMDGIAALKHIKDIDKNVKVVTEASGTAARADSTAFLKISVA